MIYSKNTFRPEALIFSLNILQIRKCDVCQRHQTVKKEAAKLVPAQAVEPLHMVGIYFVGPLPQTPNGNIYILVFMDYFTEWVEFYPLKQKSVVCVAKKIQSYIYR